MRVVEINPGLFVGDEEFYKFGEIWNRSDWVVTQAAKFPFHRDALGYSGVAAPKDSPEYLFAVRGNRLAMNFVDAKQGGYVPMQMFEAGLSWIRDGLHAGKKVLIHCNLGESRGPSLAMAYLGLCGILSEDYSTALAEFKHGFYPFTNFGVGVGQFMEANWPLFAAGRKV